MLRLRHLVAASASLAVGACASQPSVLTSSDFAGLDRQVENLFAAYPATPGDAFPVRREIGREVELSEVYLDTLSASDADFAGHYIVATRGCGTACQLNLVVNPQAEDARPVVTSRFGVEYRLNSRLMISNPPAEIADYGDDELPPSLRPRCLVLQANESFAEIDCQFDLSVQGEF